MFVDVPEMLEPFISDCLFSLGFCMSLDNLCCDRLYNYDVGLEVFTLIP